MKSTHLEPLLTISQVAEILQSDTRTVRKLIALGKLKALNISTGNGVRKNLRFTKADVLNIRS